LEADQVPRREVLEVQVGSEGLLRAALEVEHQALVDQTLHQRAAKRRAFLEAFLVAARKRTLQAMVRAREALVASVEVQEAKAALLDLLRLEARHQLRHLLPLLGLKVGLDPTEALQRGNRKADCFPLLAVEGPRVALIAREVLEVLVVVAARELFQEARHSVAPPVREGLVLVAA